LSEEEEEVEEEVEEEEEEEAVARWHRALASKAPKGAAPGPPPSRAAGSIC
jgi:hypothetical protein